MNDSEFDNRIKKVLNDAANEVSPPEDMLYRIKNFSAAEENKMKRFNPFKTAVVCIAAVMALTVGVIGAGKLMYVESHSTTAEEIDHFPTQNELDKVIDFKPRYTEKLGQYDFDYCLPVHSSNIGENGEHLNDYTGMSFNYKTDKGILALDTDTSPLELGEADCDISEYNGVKYYYHNTMFKFVPTDYKLTDEDKAKQDAGELEISYGSEEVELKQSQSICWEQDGVSYCLLDLGVEIDKDKFIDMAKSIIDVK